MENRESIKPEQKGVTRKLISGGKSATYLAFPLSTFHKVYKEHKREDAENKPDLGVRIIRSMDYIFIGAEIEGFKILLYTGIGLGINHFLTN